MQRGPDQPGPCECIVDLRGNACFMTVRVFPVGLPVRVFGLLTGWSASPVFGSLDPMGTTFNKISRKWCRAGATRVAAATLALGIGVTALGAAPTVAPPPEDAVKVRMQTLVDAGYPAALAARTERDRGCGRHGGSVHGRGASN